MTSYRKHLPALIVLCLASAASILLGYSLAHSVPGGMMGFPGIYQGTQCLLHGCDPYDPQQLQGFYEASGMLASGESPERLQAVTLYVNLPTTFLFVAPFTVFPLQKAQTIWSVLLIAAFLTATLLMWELGTNFARRLALMLASILLANCVIVFSGGNTAGFVVAFTVIAAWCFVQSKAEWVGVLCLAVALTMKPHDSGMVWLYFLLAGVAPRKRALQSAAIAAALTLVAVAWVSLTVPHWLTEMRTNFAAISAPGGINEPGPASIGVNSPDMIIDLQTVFSIVHNEPRFYNTVTYLICGVLFVLWVRAVRRARFTPETAWPALVAGTMLSMLVTYHRSYDAKLLLFAIPACSLLWSRRNAVGRGAFAVTVAAFLLTADIPLTAVALWTGRLPMSSTGVLDKLVAIAFGRPAPLILLAVTVFYLWVLFQQVRRAPRKELDCSASL